MSFITTEYVTSRANATMFLPRGMPNAVQEAVDTLVFFCGKETVMDAIGQLEDATDDTEYTESLFSYSSLFSDATQMLVDEIAVGQYVNGPDKFLSKGKSRAIVPIPAGYMVLEEKGTQGGHLFRIMEIGGESAWIDAPRGRPDLAVEKFQEVQQVAGIEILDGGYTIPRECVPTLSQPSGDEFGSEVSAYEKELDASRTLRQQLPAESKSMVTPGYQKTGTYWKFEPILQDMQKLVSDPKLILVCGTGRNGNSGICLAVQAIFPSADKIAYDPIANLNTFHSKWQVFDRPFDPGEYKGAPPDLVVTDVSVGEDRSYDVDYSVKFAVKLCKAFKCPMLYKDNIRNLTKRRCYKIYFGRGHNTEMFVLRGTPDEKYVAVEDARIVLQDKRRANMCRNYFHAFKVRAKCNDKIEMYDPVPFRNGNTVCKPWSKCRKYNSGMSVASYVRLLAGYDVSTLSEDTPVRNLVEMVRAMVFIVPNFDACDLLGSSKRVFKEVALQTTGTEFGYGKNKPSRKTRATKAGNASKVIRDFFG